ncbi:hypothetical protein L1887_09122 [Cichorium endivia]|nr:hypothetical protein L1887_09122 [Cichorium endivia]
MSGSLAESSVNLSHLVSVAVTMKLVVPMMLNFAFYDLPVICVIEPPLMYESRHAVVDLKAVAISSDSETSAPQILKDLSKDCGLFVCIHEEDIKFYKYKLLEIHEKNKVLEKENKDHQWKNRELEKEKKDLYKKNRDLEDRLTKANIEVLKK